MKRSRQVTPKVTPVRVRMDYRPYFAAAGFAILLALAYSNSFDGDFLMDNAEMIRDTRIHAVTWSNLHRIFTQLYWEGMADRLYRPLATLSYLFNYSILGNGSSPAGYHWVNLLL